MMKVLGIGGSPRKGGNSDLLLESALDGARSRGAKTDKIILNELDFKPCQECGGCDENGICVIEDEMGIVYKEFEEADAVIIASPIFFGSITAQLKMMVDRFQCRWIGKYILKRPVNKKKRRGVFIAVAGSRRIEFFENARQIIRIFFNILSIKYDGDLFFGGVDKKSAIKEDALKKAFALGESLVA